MRRNCNISLYKFIASVCIAIYHFEWLYIGHPVFFVHFYIWAEFFFLVSGFFLAFTKDIENITVEYWWKRYKKLFPMYLIAFGITWLLVLIISRWDVRQALGALYNAKWEMFMIHMWGISSDVKVNIVTGQIPALLVAGIVVKYMIQYHRKFVENLGIVVSVAIYIYILNKYGNLSQWESLEGFVCVGILRAIAGVMLGAWTSIVLVPKAKLIKKSDRNKLLFCLGIIVSGLVWFRNHITYTDLLLYIFVFAGVIVLSYVEDSVQNSKVQKVCYKLEQLSYPIYLIHYAVILGLRQCWPGGRYSLSVAACVGITLLAASGLLRADEIIKKCKYRIG